MAEPGRPAGLADPRWTESAQRPALNFEGVRATAAVMRAKPGFSYPIYGHVAEEDFLAGVGLTQRSARAGARVGNVFLVL